MYNINQSTLSCDQSCISYILLAVSARKTYFFIMKKKLFFMCLQEKAKRNQTRITEVILLGFQISEEFRILLFNFFFIIYSLTLFGNVLIITLVSYSQTLHTPMYFFLTQLSISEIIMTTDILPNFLFNILQKGGSMSLTNCILQLYLFLVMECFECLILTAMSYDRYLAICRPLHYTSIMNKVLCIQLAITFWLMSIFSMMLLIATIACLDFCHFNVIDHFFCEIPPVLKLSCSDLSMVHLEITLLTVPILFLPFTLIVISYSYVIFTILKIPSTTSKQKAFSTCSSHLTVVAIFYITLICIYAIPSNKLSLTESKLISLLYSVGTPLINPIIYSLRNKDMKTAFKKLISQLVIL
ncbi:olfactory receptor 10A7-like [Gastrophryne carolinensis]